MTPDIKELVKRLRRTVFRSDWDDTIVYANPDGVAAADALEALAGEVGRLKEERDRFLAGGLEADNRTFRATRRAEAAEAERDRLKAALQPFARFAKMFAEAREHRRGHVPVEPNAEWYARETKQGTYILTPGMFDEALSALGDAS